HFTNPETTILDSLSLSHFEEVAFFEPKIAYRVVANFEKIKKGKLVKMPTSTERIAEYREYGCLKFNLNGVKCKLIVYQSQRHLNHPVYSKYLFCPFTDLSTGNESYGTGRYLDITIDDINEGKGEVVIDFNYCYAPYCAYSYKYSCPVPPTKNYLKTKVLAGATGVFEH
ncbi:MAG: DUF1684 domain-containing protein, partial [Flavobacteriales bacterium]